jgi:hypothetical protein
MSMAMTSDENEMRDEGYAAFVVWLMNHEGWEV